MKAGIIVFAYNRDRHLEKVLDGLKKNEEISKIYIFQDGLKCEEHRNGWEKTQQVIKGIDWCEVVYELAPDNKGLANSIVDGINAVFMDHDAVIVLEDDCVPTANFISFMMQCFDKYQDDTRVYSVSGFSWPINLPQDAYDIYGCGRISSLGWGTWKDRWEQFSIDNDILKRLKKDKEASLYLAAWGSDCEQTLYDQIAGKNDSWAIYWALTVIEKRGICINPYKSLIHNIGMDGTGVHSAVTDQLEVEMDSGVRTDFNLPKDLGILHTTEYAFADFHGSYTAASINDKSKENVLVYGMGNYFCKYEREINDNYNIAAFIDQYKKGWYAGRKVFHLGEVMCDVNACGYDRIIIMVQSIQECIKIVKEMVHNGIDYKTIILGHSLYGIYSRTVNQISIMNDGRFCVTFGSVSIKIESEDEFHNVYEVFVNQIYNYFVNNTRRDIVIDVGMNIGDSTLYFAQRKNVDKVYGYEPFGKTFMRAEENLRQYIDMDKISIFRYGISNENATRLIGFNADMTCGQSTLEEVREYAYGRYREWGLAQEENEQIEKIEVRKASEVFKPILNEYPHHNIVLKMDCEGEEYGILADLLQKGMLEKFQFVMLEWHYKGKEFLLDCLEKAGFSWWCSERSMEMGFVYAYQ